MNNARRDEAWLARNRPVQAPHCPVNNPAHYTEGRSFEPIDVIEDWELGFHLGNALKYIARAGRKGDSHKEDLSKAIWYLNKELDRLTDNRVNGIPSSVIPGSDADIPFYDSEQFDEYKDEIWELERQHWSKDLSKFEDQEVYFAYPGRDGSVKGAVKGGEPVYLKKPEHEDVVEYFDWYEETPCDV